MAKRNTKDRRATITAEAADRTMTAEMSVAWVTNPDGKIAFPQDTALLPPVNVLYSATPEGKRAAEVHAKQIQAAKMPRNEKTKKDLRAKAARFLSEWKRSRQPTEAEVAEGIKTTVKRLRAAYGKSY